jgi:hypothetical protein
MNGILLQKTLSLVTDGTAQEMKGVVNNGFATRIFGWVRFSGARLIRGCSVARPFPR